MLSILIAFSLVGLVGGIYGLVRLIGAQHLLRQGPDVVPSWRRELGGVTIEGKTHLSLYPTQAIIDGRILPMAAYAVVTQRLNSELSAHHRITILGIQTDGNELTLLEAKTEAREAWEPLVRAVQSISIELDRDSGTEEDIPAALLSLTQPE